MKHRTHRGTARLARTMRRSHPRRSTEPPYTSDLGTITSRMGLALDRFSIEIPDGDYLVEETFTARTEDEAGGAGEASFANHSHLVRAPLAPGDRVTVRILDAGQDEWTALVDGRLGP